MSLQCMGVVGTRAEAIASNIQDPQPLTLAPVRLFEHSAPIGFLQQRQKTAPSTAVLVTPYC